MMIYLCEFAQFSTGWAGDSPQLSRISAAESPASRREKIMSYLRETEVSAVHPTSSAQSSPPRLSSSQRSSFEASEEFHHSLSSISMTNQAAAAAEGRMEQQVPPPFYVDPSDLARAGYDSDGVEVEQQQPNPATATAAAAMLRGGGELHQSSSQHQPSSSHEPHFHGETSQQAAAGGGGGEEGAFSSSSSSSLSSRQQHPRTLFPFGGQLNSNTNPPPLSEQWQQEGTGRALEHPHRQQGYQHQELYQHQEQYRHLQDHHHHHLSTHHHHEQHQQPQQQQQQPLHTSRTAALYEHHCHLLARRKAKAEELVAQQGFDFVPKLASTTKQATEARQSSRVAPGHAFERLIADADSKAKEQAKVILCLPPFAPSWPSVVSRFFRFWYVGSNSPPQCCQHTLSTPTTNQIHRQSCRLMMATLCRSSNNKKR